MHPSSVSGKRFRPPPLRPRSRSFYRILPLLLLLPAAAFLRPDLQWWRRVNSEKPQIPIHEESSNWLQFGSEQATSFYNTVVNVGREKKEGAQNARPINGEPQENAHLQTHHDVHSQPDSLHHHDERDMSHGHSDNEDEGKEADSTRNHVHHHGIADDGNDAEDDEHNEDEDEDEDEDDDSEDNSDSSSGANAGNTGGKDGFDRQENAMDHSSLGTRQQGQVRVDVDEQEHYTISAGGAQEPVSIHHYDQSSPHTLEDDPNDGYHESEHDELKADATLGDRHAQQSGDTNAFDNSIYNHDNSHLLTNLHSISSHTAESQHRNRMSADVEESRYHDRASLGSFENRIHQSQLQKDTHHGYNTENTSSDPFKNYVHSTNQSAGYNQEGHLARNVKESRFGEESYGTQRDSAPSSDAHQWAPYIQPKEDQNGLSSRHLGDADDPQASSSSSFVFPSQTHSDERSLSSERDVQTTRESSWDAPHQPITDPEYHITTQDLRTAFKLLPINQTLVESGLLPLLTSYDIRNDTEFKELALHGNLTDMYIRYASLLRRGHGSILGPPYNKPVDNIYHVRHSANPNKGYSMYASEDIPAETILGSYGGELVLSSRLKHGQYAWEAPSMFLRTESGVWKEHATTLDSSRVGNLLRFVNDLGDGTYNLEPVWVPLQNRWTLFYKTSRPVKAGEEFSISYGPDYWGEDDSTLLPQRRMAVARESVSPPEITGAFMQNELRMRSRARGQVRSTRSSGHEEPIGLRSEDTTGQRNSNSGAVIHSTQERKERLSPTQMGHVSNSFSERLSQPLTGYHEYV